MRLNINITLFLAFLSLSCFGQDNNADFNLTIFPSSGGNFGYVIEVEESTLKISSKKLIIKNNKIVLGETKEFEKRRLSKCQISRISSYLKGIESLKIKNMDTELPYDIWVFDFFINGNQSIKTNSVLLKESSELKKTEKFIAYLIKLSPLKIKLRGFS